MGDVIGVEPGSEREAEAVRLLEALGAKRLVGSIEAGLETKLDSVELSSSERSAIAAVRAVMSDAPLVLFDDPTEHLGKAAALRWMGTVLDACAGRTVVASFSRQPPAGLFDRVIVIRKAKVVHDSAGCSIAPAPGGVSSVCESGS